MQLGEEQKIVIVFDGECQFCINQINTIKSMDDAHQFEYVPRNSENLDQRFPILKDMNFDSGMRLITPDNHAYVGADAIHQIAKRLPSTKYFAWLYAVPGIHQLAKLLYAWVAANRQKLASQCKTGVCGPP